MQRNIGQSYLELIQGDITKQDTEAIANAANSQLIGGGGVDGAIHLAGGPEIMEELKKKYSECPTGSAVITSGGKLKARYVIHAVGPRYKGKPDDQKLLKQAYLSTLKLCNDHKIKSIAFPSISTGIYGYPVEEASRIALKAIIEYIRTHPEINLVRFILFNTKTYENYKKTLKELLP